MRNKPKPSFRPGVESVEGRCMATAGIGGVLALGAGHRAVHAAAVAAPSSGMHALQASHVHRATPMIAPGGKMAVFAEGITAKSLPNNYINWGVLTFWNTTNTRVVIGVSASTYQGGRYFNFVLRPGQYQSYYAAFTPLNNPPVFRASFDPVNHTNSVELNNPNTVYERLRWFPRVGTEGRPFAIVNSGSGFYLAAI